MWSSCPIRVIKERTGRSIAWSSAPCRWPRRSTRWAAAPARRSAWNCGVELLAGVKIAAATLNPPFGTDLFAPRISSAMLGLGTSAAGAPVLDVESLAPLVVSTYPELREAADPAAPPARAVAPVVLNGRIDPPGDDDRFVLAVDAGPAAANQGPSLRARLGARRRLASARQRRLGARQCRRHHIPLPPKNGQQPQSLVLPDPSLDLTVPGGTNEITLVIRDLENRGGIGFPYRIVVEPLFPDFQLLANESAGQRSPGRHGRGRRDGPAQGLQRSDHRDRCRPARGADRAPGYDRRRPDHRRALACPRPPTPSSPPLRSSSSAAAQGANGPIRTARVQAGGLRPADHRFPRARSRNTAWSPPRLWRCRSRSTRPLPRSRSLTASARRSRSR